jgi:hypothetical protein
VLITVLLGLAFLVRFRAGVGAGLATWQEARSGVGTVDAIATVLAFFAIPAPIVMWLSGRRVAAVVLAPIVLVQLQLAGSRAMALTIPALVAIAIMRGRGSALGKAARLTLLTALALAMFIGFRVVRNVPLSDVPTNLGAALTTPGNDISGGESRILGSLYYLLDRDLEEAPYDSGVTVQRLATIYLQRGGSIPKPNDITYEIWSDYLDDGHLDRDPYLDDIRRLADAGTPGSDHPTVWGDAVANFRLLGVPLYAAVLGATAVVLELLTTRLSAVSRVTIVPVVAVAYQFIARGNVVIAVGYLAYGLPVVAALLWITRRTVGSGQRTRTPALAPSST